MNTIRKMDMKNMKKKNLATEYITPSRSGESLCDKYTLYFTKDCLVKLPKKQTTVDNDSIYNESDIRELIQKCLKEKNSQKAKKNIESFIKKDNKKSYVSNILQKLKDRNDLKDVMEMYMHYELTNICYFYNRLFAFSPELEFEQHKRIFKFFSKIVESGSKNVAKKMKSVINKIFNNVEDYSDRELLNIIINLENDMLFKFVKEFTEHKHLKSLNLHYNDFMKENKINPSKLVINENIEEEKFEVNFDKREVVEDNDAENTEEDEVNDKEEEEEDHIDEDDDNDDSKEVDYGEEDEDNYDYQENDYDMEE